jgi:small-conductance mechanosensitive channel
MSAPQSNLDLTTLLDPVVWQTHADALWTWIQAEALSTGFAIQLAAIITAIVLGFATKRQCTAIIARIFRFEAIERFQSQAVRFITPIAGPASSWILLSVLLFGLQQSGTDTYLVRTAANLVGAWAAIRLLSAFIAEPFWARTAAATAWTIAALNILGWLDPAASFLDGLGFDIGEDGRLSVLTVLRTAIVLALFYWVASTLSRLLSTRIEKLPSLNPSARILITKAAQVVLMATAGMMALSANGIDLSALAIFGGAVGLGIGFGLQKIFSNLVSGVLLLLDRSIKPGDVITVDETYGRVSTLGMRFASVITRDGHEHLIPNEEFITTKVVNWSYSDSAVRIKRSVGVSYGSDVRLAQKLIVEAAESVPRVLKTPKTRCHLRNFGDNSLDLEVRFWIRDPQDGVNNVTSEVLLAIWDSFREHGIEFPFPQRDVHLVGNDPINVRLAPED